jgi:hypothetical protein
VRFREDRHEDLDRARRAVATWRDQNPEGTAEQLVAALGAEFHRDYGPVLRALLFTADRHPDVIIGMDEFGNWQARIPEPNGETVSTRPRLRELHDKLDKIIVERSGQPDGGFG